MRRPPGEFGSGGKIASVARGTREFWALEDVSFEIQTGEVVGIVGRNGAGKSTLLKILGRITRPTRGGARVRGRVGTLLEVGTGFHPELSGRENIFLNGAILGMRMSEIRRKFDEIVDFAEVEAFLETPVKRYSSGMYVRLAFAVAAHLQPEILLIDEVLAVGDVAFQKKCLARMESLSHTNHTVLFVSHNLGAIRQLCPRSIVIDGGHVVHDGTTTDALRTYNELLRNITVDGETNLPDRLKRCTGSVRFTSVRVENAAGEKEWDFHAGDTIRVRLAYEVYEPVDDLWFHFSLQSGSHAGNHLDRERSPFRRCRCRLEKKARSCWNSRRWRCGRETMGFTSGWAANWGSRTTI